MDVHDVDDVHDVIPLTRQRQHQRITAWNVLHTYNPEGAVDDE